MEDSLDLRVEGETNILVTKGISYPNLSWDIPNIPDAFTLKMFDWGGNAETVWEVGNGLSISGSRLFWNLGLVPDETGEYFGIVESANKEFGIHFFSKIKITVYEKCNI